MNINYLKEIDSLDSQLKENEFSEKDFYLTENMFNEIFFDEWCDDDNVCYFDGIDTVYRWYKIYKLEIECDLKIVFRGDYYYVYLNGDCYMGKNNSLHQTMSIPSIFNKLGITYMRWNSFVNIFLSKNFVDHDFSIRKYSDYAGIFNLTVNVKTKADKLETDIHFVKIGNKLLHDYSESKLEEKFCRLEDFSFDYETDDLLSCFGLYNFLDDDDYYDNLIDSFSKASNLTKLNISKKVIDNVYNMFCFHTGLETGLFDFVKTDDYIGNLIISNYNWTKEDVVEFEKDILFGENIISSYLKKTTGYSPKFIRCLKFKNNFSDDINKAFLWFKLVTHNLASGVNNKAFKYFNRKKDEIVNNNPTLDLKKMEIDSNNFYLMLVLFGNNIFVAIDYIFKEDVLNRLHCVDLVISEILSNNKNYQDNFCDLVKIVKAFSFTKIDEVYNIATALSLIDFEILFQFSNRAQVMKYIKELIKNKRFIKELDNASKSVRSAIQGALDGKIEFSDEMKTLKEIEIKSKKYSMKMLDKTDVVGLGLGNFTNCCQRIGGAGQSCVVAGYEDPDSGFIVFYKGDDVIAQSWVYVVKRKHKTVFVFDNIESLSDEGYKDIVRELVTEWCSVVMSKNILDEIHLGLGYNDVYFPDAEDVLKKDIKFPKSFKKGTSAMRDDDDSYGGLAVYTDAKRRKLLAKK